MCVEINLQKPLLPGFDHFGEDCRFEYEGLHLVCFHYGKYGQCKEQCSLQNSDQAECSGVRGQQPKEMTFVYASPNVTQRRTLWGSLIQLSYFVQEAWCLGGDFNATLTTQERHSIESTRGPDREFCSFVEEVG
ncbi:hypothetical protein K1719_013007 [Acacia pycnantha]|nr:hypothetical protein K1719_013007 [Acacia pycnantha]